MYLHVQRSLGQPHIFKIRKDKRNPVVLSQVVLFSFIRNLVSSQRNTISHLSPLSVAGTQWLELNELLQYTNTTKFERLGKEMVSLHQTPNTFGHK